MKNSVKILGLALVLLVSVGCKSTNRRTSEESSFKGSVAQSPPGGTLVKQNFDNYDCKQFKEAVWYRLSRPVGMLIWHQYIGLRLTEQVSANPQEPATASNRFFTSGLSDPSDNANINSWWRERGESNKYAHMISSKRYTDCAAFLAAVKRINNAMASSNYQSGGIRVLAMVVAPVPVLGGRPCAKLAASATGTWLSAAEKDSAPDFCDHCTEVISDSSWSKDSVDWDESALEGASDSNRK
jgi:hypothetical protein